LIQTLGQNLNRLPHGLKTPDELNQQYRRITLEAGTKILGLFPLFDIPVKVIDLTSLAKDFSQIPSLAQYMNVCLTCSKSFLYYVAAVHRFEEEDFLKAAESRRIESEQAKRDLKEVVDSATEQLD
jgi:hypothetical protein